LDDVAASAGADQVELAFVSIPPRFTCCVPSKVNAADPPTRFVVLER